VRPALALALALLPGCWLQDAEIEGVLYGTDGTDTDTADLGDIALVSLTPSSGPVTGGEQVDVVVTGVLSDAPVVHFGGVAAELVGVADGVIRVLTPVGSQGFVDVSVTDQGRVAQLANGYQYFPDRRGFTTMIGDVWWRDELGPTNMAVSQGGAWVMPIDPVASSYRDLIYGVGGMDQCQVSVEPSLFGQTLNLSHIPLTRVDNGATYDLLYRFQTRDYSASLSNQDYVPGATYDLGPFEGGPWPSTLVSGAVELPLGLTVTAPAVNDFWSLSDGDLLRWSHAANERGDFVVVHVETDSVFGSGEYVDCVVVDDGEFQFDTTLFDFWYFNTTVRLALGRVQVAQATVPFDGSSTQIAGIYWVSSVGVASGF